MRTTRRVSLAMAKARPQGPALGDTSTLTADPTRQQPRREPVSRLVRLGHTVNDRRVRAFTGLLIAIAIWEAVGRISGPNVLPTPLAVAIALTKITANGQLPAALGTSLIDLGAGLAISCIAGVGVGLLLGRYRVIEEMFDPIVNLFNATPMVAILPLVIIWLGLGVNARVLYIVLLSIWSILINTSEGMANIPKAFGELGRAFGLSEHQIVWKIGVPATIPYLVTGLRIAIGRAVIGMVIAEMQVNEVGTGGLVQSYGGAFEPARLLAVVLVLAVFGWALVAGLRLLARWRFPWTAEIAAAKR